MVLEVIRGSVQDAPGVLLRKEKQHRLVLAVRFLQQTAAVRIEMSRMLIRPR